MKFITRLFSSKKNNTPRILLEEQSPLCPIKATVEEDGRVVYFYLTEIRENTGFATKACWVRNLIKAPESYSSLGVDKGIAPLMPREFCKYPEGQENLKEEYLEVVWFAEGDAAALKYKSEIIAVIPSWGGFKSFLGYARDAIGQGNFAWEFGELNKENALYNRIKSNELFWIKWSKEDNPFNINQPLIVNQLEEQLGELTQYYAIDDNQWPPKGLYSRSGELRTVFSTIGVSLIPMPKIEMYVDNYNEKNKIELGLMLDSNIDENQLQTLTGWISSQAELPWGNITFLAEGHTINLAELNNSKMEYVLLTSRLKSLPKVELYLDNGSKINFIWMVPISEREKSFVVDNSADELIIKLNSIGSEVFSLNRDEVI